MREYDLVIIGAGPGGYEAALEAAGTYGMKTALVEKEALGGTCLNHGCIPTKALLHAAELFQGMKECETFGLHAGEVSFDMEQVQRRKNETIDQLKQGIGLLMKQKKVTVFQGIGTVQDAHTVTVKQTEDPAGQETILDTEYILITTGSKAVFPPIRGAELEHVVTSDELLEKKDGLYDRLLIIGGGVIGMEFASVYTAFGAEVTVVEALPRVIANMDKELSQSLKMLMKKRGVHVYTDARVEEIRKAEDGSLECLFTEKEKAQALKADGILICTGRRPYTEGLFAPGAEPAMERGFICTDEYGRTSIPGVYAAGDVTGKMMLAHYATAAAKNAVAHMNLESGEKSSPINLSVVPSCIYTNPEIASVGLTLEEAKEKGIQALSRKIVMSANGKTVLAGLDRGFIKVVYEAESEKILGAQMMCGRASDLISEFTQAIVSGRTMREMGEMIRPHPTFSEAITEACRL